MLAKHVLYRMSYIPMDRTFLMRVLQLTAIFVDLASVQLVAKFEDAFIKGK